MRVCQNCQHFKESVSECRKNPPQISVTNAGVESYFPTVELNDYCGGHNYDTSKLNASPVGKRA